MLDECINAVKEFDSHFEIEKENENTVENLIYNALALAGEAGEVANAAKKIWRDGNTPKRMDDVEEELVDVMIYLCKIIIVGEIDFKAAFEKKFAKLYDLWESKQAWERQALLREKLRKEQV
jgi:NTP pyrophosphatase (non-canonical NTP hydrolase)